MLKRTSTTVFASVLLLIFCITAFCATYDAPENYAYAKSTVLNYIHSADVVVVAKVEKSGDYQSLPNKRSAELNSQLEIEDNQSPSRYAGMVDMYADLQVQSVLKGEKIKNVTLLYSVVSGTPQAFIDGSSYIIGLTNGQIGLDSKELKYDSGFVHLYQFEIASSQSIVTGYKLIDADRISLNEVKKWPSLSMTQKYVGEKKFLARVNKKTTVVPTLGTFSANVITLGKGDEVVMLDRPDEVRDGKSYVTILCSGQEGLVEKQSLVMKNGEVVNASVPAKSKLLVVTKSSYIYSSAKRESGRTGIARKNSVICVVGKSGNFNKVKLSNGKFGYVETM